MLNFCTLFDINYINHGLTMYESLKRHCEDFHLYVFAFCDKSYNLLKKLNLEKVTVISLKEFEDEELLKVKPTRSKGEYCWTCTSSTILYCLKNFNLENCTYLDADLYFYDNPKILIDEMEANQKTVLITEHRYTPRHDASKTSGKYCVQFMTFKNEPKALEVLNWWRNSCIEWCYARYEDGKFGDQKYLDDWLTRFDCIHSLENLGGGVGPWNIQQYDFKQKNKKIYLIKKSDKSKTPVIFFHMEVVKVQSDGFIANDRPDLYDIPYKYGKLFYKNYMKSLIKTNTELRKISPDLTEVKMPKPNFKAQKRQLRRWLFSCSFSKSHPYLRILGYYLIKPNDLGW